VAAFDLAGANAAKPRAGGPGEAQFFIMQAQARNVSRFDAARVEPSAADREVVMLIPAADAADPELSIVVPALNEESTIAPFIAWCREGIAKAGVRAEIVIVDSSTDRTPELALAAGARVLRTPKRGLGRAYIDALPFVRGRYVIMGDADCTYDFRDLEPFIAKFRAGCEFVMGSRFAGSIEDGAMPALHRYFGTPLTTFILNRMYGTDFTDIHCGMRGITRDALQRIGLASQGWEYASEMVLKSVHLQLQRAEVPVNFLKDPQGRTSHHVRAGWTSPWKAGWSNLQAMFVFGADFFLLVPGIVLAAASLPAIVALSFGPLQIGAFNASLNAMLFVIFTALAGLQMFLIGVIGQCIYDGVGDKRRRWLALFSYTRTTLACAAAGLIGLALTLPFVRAFAAAGYTYSDSMVLANHRAVFGVFLAVAAVMIFVSMLIMQAVAIYVPLPARRAPRLDPRLDP
jgi:glycosyltransferase involved in cell wall biosynthesis